MSLNTTRSPDDSLLPVAPEVMTPRYIAVGTLAVFIWEILININNDYKILFQRRIRLTTIIYFLSKISCLVFVASATVLRLGPTLPSTCESQAMTVNIPFATTITFTSFLFFIRTRAIFNKNPWIVALFAGLWLAVLGSCLTFAIGVLVPSGYQKLCFATNLKPYTAAVTIVPLINDTLVFIAITWRLCSNSYVGSTLKDGFNLVVFGDYLPRFSKAILQDGQAYYLTIVSMNLVAVIMLFNPSVPEVIGTIFQVPNVVLTNMMACRVYRNTLFGLQMIETQISTRPIPRELHNIPPSSPTESDGSRSKRSGDDGTSVGHKCHNGDAP